MMGVKVIFLKGKKMQLKLDVKTLVVGIVLGLVIAFVLGVNGVRGVSRGDAAGGADKADFGIAVQNKGTALVRTLDGNLFLIEPPSNKARLVLYESGPNKGRPLSVSGTGRAKKSSAK